MGDLFGQKEFWCYSSKTSLDWSNLREFWLNNVKNIFDQEISPYIHKEMIFFLEQSNE